MSRDSIFFYCCQTVLKRGSNNSFGDLLPADSGTESISGPRSSPSSAASSSDHDGPSSLNIKPFPVIQVEEISHVLNVILHIIYDISVASHGPSFDFLAETLPCLVRYGIPNPNPDGNSDFWALIMTYAPFYPFRVYALASAYDGGDPACTTASEHTLQRRLTEMTVDDASHMGGVRLWQLVRLHLDRTEALVGIITSPPGSHVPTNSCSADDQTALAQSWRLGSDTIEDHGGHQKLERNETDDLNGYEGALPSPTTTIPRVTNYGRRRTTLIFASQPISHSTKPDHLDTDTDTDTDIIQLSRNQLHFRYSAKWIKSLTKDRLGQFVGGHFNEVNLGAVLFFERRDDEKHVQMKMWSAPGKAKPSFDDVMKLEDKDWKEATKGVKIGPSCESHLGYALTNHWFKVHLNIPSGWNKYERIQLEFDPGCEAMIFETDGNPLQGITGGYDGDRRVDFIIPKEARRKGSIDVIIEVSANGMFGISGVGPPDPNRYFSLASADLVVPNQEGWRLLWDFNTLRELVDDLGGDSILQNKCLYVANKIMNTFDVKESDRTIKECREIAEEVFGKGWDAKGGRVYEEGLGEGKHKKRAQVWGIGNCHIDTAWLWPYSVTQQKAARSWATQLDLMDRYPEHRFATSTAQQFKWVEQLYPKLFERIQAKVKTGQFQLVGGSWVENDSNMPSGEALARQMIFGQRYFRSRFGVTCKVAWLPDSFGYSAGFPQLMRGCGMANFFTQKLSWNNVNTFPHSTFNWVGNDGTQVLCHMTPVGTYTAQATTSDNLESSDTGLLAFGNGDGGGGPLNKMLENLRRIRATANENRELPIVHMGNSVDEFFEDIHQTTDEGKTLPTWHGELYLEFHRATYTSHGSIKKGNRHSERLLRDVEYLATMASVYHPDDYQYPKERIDIAWEKVLLNQFHDVLPGSAIGMVYEDAEVLYSEVTKVGKQIIDEALDVLLKHSLSLESVALGTTERVEGDIAVINSTPFHRRELVQVPLSIGWTDSPGKRVAQDMHNRKLGYAVADVAGKMVCGLAPLHGRASARNIGKGEFQLKNEHVEMRISGGRIVGLFDVKAGRELIPQGQTGGMVMFERDMPSYWDAWDAEIHHLETSRPLEFTNVSIFEAGPARATLAAEISLDAVTATTADSSRPFIRFAAKVDWHERHKFLKFEIPVDIHADTAYFESAFGHVSRPTNKNTTQEAAKFEVCGHRFADLSEFGYGVALLTESKYGYAVSGNVMRLSLLRGATSPDAEQDQGEHVFSWAVLPHLGHFFQSDVVQAAYAFNSPLHLRFMPKSLQSDIAQSPLSTASPFIVENASNVILDTVKRGDDDSSDGDPTIILRFYEAYGGHARANVMISDKLHVSKATITNLLEEDAESLDLLRSNISDAGTSFALCFRGFQVITVQLVLKKTLVEDAEEQLTRRKHDSWVTIEKE
ncbi:Glycoside hydrolase, 38 vacuolar alpha mannosidase [Tulasnella sp. 330]|nr:Glycoside hydrolase, 38 vacuolar alpha mannosidase [Tulasnella sp. 330]